MATGNVRHALHGPSRRSEVTLALDESINCHAVHHLQVAYSNAVLGDITDCTLLGYWQSASRDGY